MSASTSPSEKARAADFRHQVTQSFEAQNLATETDKIDQLVSIQSFALKFIKDAARQASEYEEGLNCLWHMFCITAQNLQPEDSFQDSLVSLLLWTKEYDSLYRQLHPNEVADGSWAGYGFVKELQSSWEHLSTERNVAKMCNLAMFSAKCFAIGVSDEIERTATWVMRNALETEEDMDGLVYLPSAAIMVQNCAFKLFSLRLMRLQGTHSPEEDRPASAQKAGIHEVRFSQSRWLYWRRRFQEIGRHHDPIVAAQAKKGFMAMISCGRLLDLSVLGELRFEKHLQQAMWEELKRSGKDSVDGDEININLDWVDVDAEYEPQQD
ncbi:hypothetical protein CGLO_11444 [Colletotrichum gloeosporioides Cg-14]|uniref:Uncharacterized protein n=1 Tax=Colletotrichum gloeosporioides (strain Cg-14) TaxID=1237896 RepID=T0K0R8_COLGC|nr:hypothetical protein CGLO_11444 [Colletotrichum gloeosporioides Cg-14]